MTTTRKQHDPMATALRQISSGKLSPAEAALKFGLNLPALMAYLDDIDHLTVAERREKYAAANKTI